MWAVVTINRVTQVIPGAQQVIINDVRHPAAIFRSWTNEELANIGVFPLEVSSRDTSFYEYRGERFDIQSDKVVKVWDRITPKDMDQLKKGHTSRISSTALSLLKSTDWYVLRKTETKKAIPAKVVTYRAAVRAAEKAIIDVISATTTVEELKALFDVPLDKDGKVSGKAPMGNWPDELDD